MTKVYLVQQEAGKSLIETTKITKLDGIAAGAQVNVIEEVQAEGTALTITDKKVNVTRSALGAAAASHTHGNDDLLTGIDASKITTGTLPVSVIPPAALSKLVIVADQAARLALTISDVQNGDVVKQNDTGILYFVSDDSKLGTEAAFTEFKAGEAASVDWANVKNKVNASATADGLMTSAGFTKLSGIAEGAEVNVQSDWNVTDTNSDAYIQNKPSLGTAAAKNFTAAVTESSADLVTSGAVYTGLAGKVDAETGKRLMTTAEGTKLSGIAEGAQVNVIETVKVNGTALDVSNKAVDVTVPTKVSDLTNDSGFQTATQVSTTVSTAVSTHNSANDAHSTLFAAKEDTANKTTSVRAAASADDTYFPTEKAVRTELDKKVDAVSGKGLSTNDYDNTAKGIVDSVTTNLAAKVDKDSSSSAFTLGADANGIYFELTE